MSPRENVSHGETYLLHHADGGEYLLGKGYHQAAKKAEKSLGALAGVMALDAHAHLYHAPAQDYDAYGLDAGEDKVAEVIHHRQRVCPSGVGRYGKKADGQHHGRPQGAYLSCFAFVVIHRIIPPFLFH